MPYLILLILVLLSSCVKKDEKMPKQVTQSTGANQTISGSIMYAYDSSALIWELESDKMIRTDDSTDILITPVRLKMYNDSGFISTRVTSDSGTTPPAMESFFIWGNVKIITEEGNTIRSKTLHWKKGKRQLHSDDYVEIATSSGEVMQGKGFDAAEDFSWWNFHEDVTGRFEDFEKELGLDEDSTAEKGDEDSEEQDDNEE